MSLYKIADWIPEDKINLGPLLKWSFHLSGFENNPNRYLLNNLDKLCGFNCNLKKKYINMNPYLLNIPISQNDDISWKALELNKYVNNFLLLEYKKINSNELKIINNESVINILRKHIDWNELSSCQDVLAIRILRENMHRINWEKLSENPAAIEILKDNVDFIDWDIISMNQNSVEIFKNNLDKIDYSQFAMNTTKEGIDILEANLEKLDGEGREHLSENKNAIEVLKKNIDIIDWNTISFNDNAMELLEKYPHKIDWEFLSYNRNVMEILKNNLHKICWDKLSSNENAIDLLEKNHDKINWRELSSNRNALHLIEKNKYNINIDWSAIMANPDIIVINYSFLHKKMNIIREDLMMFIFNPKRFRRYYNLGYDILTDEYVL